MYSIPKEHFNDVIKDLEYVKEFKSYSVLFTTDHRAIGLGENGSYIRIEGVIPSETYLSDMIIDTRTIASVIRAADAGKISQFIINPLMITDPDGLISIATGLHPLWIESMVYKTLRWCRPFTQIYEEDITDSEEVKRLKSLKADEGNILLRRMIDEKPHIIPMNKKFVPILMGDRLTIRLFDESNATFYACFINETKKGYKFYTTIRCLRV